MNCPDLRQKIALLQAQALEFHQEFAKLQPLENVTELEQMNAIKKIFRQMTKEIKELKEAMWDLKIIEPEKRKLKEFFGKEIDVPPLPSEITPERLKKWQEQGFELHFFPDMEMKQDADFPLWKKKPSDWFYDEIKKGNIDQSAMRLPGSWILIDACPKPEYAQGNQMYANDPLAKTLADLREQGLIQPYEYVENPQSRFGISAEELENPQIKLALAKVLGVKPDQLSCPRAIEFNFFGNAFHPELGDTDTWEWFSDLYDKGRKRLDGGIRGNGGLSYVAWDYPDYRVESFGFRLLGRFS